MSVPNVKKKFQTKKNKSTTGNPSFNPKQASFLGICIQSAYMQGREDGTSSVLNATQPKQEQSAPSELKLDEQGSSIKDTRPFCRACWQDHSTASCPTLKNGDEPNEVLKKVVLDVGTKYDNGKPPLAYIPKAALDAEGAAFAYGAKKYDGWNYKLGIPVTRTLSAALRHIVQFLDGEDVDSESGAHHLGSARANLAMALDTLAHHPSFDDRFKKDVK